MSHPRLTSGAVVLGLGLLIELAIFFPQASGPYFLEKTAAQEPEKPGQAELVLLKTDVETLKQKASDQAHVMTSVAYHFNNLWFAAQHENWPLAQFYWNEVRSHLRWAVRIIPIRKDNSGQDIQLWAILEAMENSPLTQLQDAIKAEDRDQFVAAYKFSVETCYACHKAADKPFLRPQIPLQPSEPTINFDPKATWPQ